MSAFTPIEGAYSNHIGGGFTHPITGTVYFLVTWRQNSQGPYRLQVWEDAPPYGDPKMIREWITGTDAAGPGPWGYGTCTWMPDGSLYVAAPGGVDGSSVKPAIHVELNVFPPIPPGGMQGPKGDPGPAFLGGVTQGEPGAIEVRGSNYAYIDLSTAADGDFGFRLIRTATGAEIHVRGKLVVRTDKGITEL